jgi:hypothetical protein
MWTQKHRLRESAPRLSQGTDQSATPDQRYIFLPVMRHEW